jgi:hypothetical protein
MAQIGPVAEAARLRRRPGKNPCRTCVALARRPLTLRDFNSITHTYLPAKLTYRQHNERCVRIVYDVFTCAAAILFFACMRDMYASSKSKIKNVAGRHP